jgi:hypothetical protein
MFISPHTFHQQKNPCFGRSNPEVMEMPFWKMMIQTKQSAYDARVQFQVDDYTATPDSIWCFDRCGASETLLPDGRVIHIAGEHEDHQGPDFHIYNDVVVLAPDHQLTIYGYPKHIFQPSNFHSATLIGTSLLIIGNLGYCSERHIDRTPVYHLDLRSFAIEEVLTTGENPGWIFDHQAELDPTCTKILLWSGEIIHHMEQKQIFVPNQHDYQLDLTTRRWECISKNAY